AERAHVHPDDRHVLGGVARDREQRAVAAEGDQQIALPRELRLRRRAQIAVELARAVFVEEDLEAARAQVVPDAQRVCERFARRGLRGDSDRVHHWSWLTARRTSSGSITIRSPARSGPTKRIGWRTFSRMARRARAPRCCFTAAVAISKSALRLNSSWI